MAVSFLGPAKEAHHTVTHGIATANCLAVGIQGSVTSESSNLFQTTAESRISATSFLENEMASWSRISVPATHGSTGIVAKAHIP